MENDKKLSKFSKTERNQRSISKSHHKQRNEFFLKKSGNKISSINKPKTDVNSLELKKLENLKKPINFFKNSKKIISRLKSHSKTKKYSNEGNGYTSLTKILDRKTSKSKNKINFLGTFDFAFQNGLKNHSSHRSQYDGNSSGRFDLKKRMCNTHKGIGKFDQLNRDDFINYSNYNKNTIIDLSNPNHQVIHFDNDKNTSHQQNGNDNIMNFSENKQVLIQFNRNNNTNFDENKLISDSSQRNDNINYVVNTETEIKNKSDVHNGNRERSENTNTRKELKRNERNESPNKYEKIGNYEKSNYEKSKKVNEQIGLLNIYKSNNSVTHINSNNYRTNSQSLQNKFQNNNHSIHRSRDFTNRNRFFHDKSNQNKLLLNQIVSQCQYFDKSNKFIYSSNKSNHLHPPNYQKFDHQKNHQTNNQQNHQKNHQTNNQQNHQKNHQQNHQKNHQNNYQQNHQNNNQQNHQNNKQQNHQKYHQNNNLQNHQQNEQQTYQQNEQKIYQNNKQQNHQQYEQQTYQQNEQQNRQQNEQQIYQQNEQQTYQQNEQQNKQQNEQQNHQQNEQQTYQQNEQQNKQQSRSYFCKSQPFSNGVDIPEKDCSKVKPSINYLEKLEIESHKCKTLVDYLNKQDHTHSCQSNTILNINNQSHQSYSGKSKQLLENFGNIRMNTHKSNPSQDYLNQDKIINNSRALRKHSNCQDKNIVNPKSTSNNINQDKIIIKSDSIIKHSNHQDKNSNFKSTSKNINKNKTINNPSKNPKSTIEYINNEQINSYKSNPIIDKIKNQKLNNTKKNILKKKFEFMSDKRISYRSNKNSKKSIMNSNPVSSQNQNTTDRILVNSIFKSHIKLKSQENLPTFMDAYKEYDLYDMSERNSLPYSLGNFQKKSNFNKINSNNSNTLNFYFNDGDYHNNSNYSESYYGLDHHFHKDNISNHHENASSLKLGERDLIKQINNSQFNLHKYSNNQDIDSITLTNQNKLNNCHVNINNQDIDCITPINGNRISNGNMNKNNRDIDFIPPTNGNRINNGNMNKNNQDIDGTPPIDENRIDNGNMNVKNSLEEMKMFNQRTSYNKNNTINVSQISQENLKDGDNRVNFNMITSPWNYYIFSKTSTNKDIMNATNIKTPLPLKVNTESKQSQISHNTNTISPLSGDKLSREIRIKSFKMQKLIELCKGNQIKEQEKVMEWIIKEDNEEIRRHINEIDSEGNGLVHIGIKFNNIVIIKFLIKMNADFNIPDSHKITPLMMLAVNNWREGYELILPLKLNVNDQDLFGNTALHYAVVKKNLVFIQMLFSFHRHVHVRIPNEDSFEAAQLADISILIKVETLFKIYELNFHSSISHCFNTDFNQTTNFVNSHTDYTYQNQLKKSDLENRKIDERNTMNNKELKGNNLQNRNVNEKNTINNMELEGYNLENMKTDEKNTINNMELKGNNFEKRNENEKNTINNIELEENYLRRRKIRENNKTNEDDFDYRVQKKLQKNDIKNRNKQKDKTNDINVSETSKNSIKINVELKKKDGFETMNFNEMYDSSPIYLNENMKVENVYLTNRINVICDDGLNYNHTHGMNDMKEFIQKENKFDDFDFYNRYYYPDHFINYNHPVDFPTKNNCESSVLKQSSNQSESLKKYDEKSEIVKRSNNQYESLKKNNEKHTTFKQSYNQSESRKKYDEQSEILKRSNNQSESYKNSNEEYGMLEFKIDNHNLLRTREMNEYDLSKERTQIEENINCHNRGIDNIKSNSINNEILYSTKQLKEKLNLRKPFLFNKKEQKESSNSKSKEWNSNNSIVRKFEQKEFCNSKSKHLKIKSNNFISENQGILYKSQNLNNSKIKRKIIETSKTNNFNKKVNSNFKDINSNIKQNLSLDKKNYKNENDLNSRHFLNFNEYSDSISCLNKRDSQFYYGYLFEDNENKNNNNMISENHNNYDLNYNRIEYKTIMDSDINKDDFNHDDKKNEYLEFMNLEINKNEFNQNYNRKNHMTIPDSDITNTDFNHDLLYSNSYSNDLYPHSGQINYQINSLNIDKHSHHINHSHKPLNVDTNNHSCNPLNEGINNNSYNPLDINTNNYSYNPLYGDTNNHSYNPLHAYINSPFNVNTNSYSTNPLNTEINSLNRNTYSNQVEYESINQNTINSNFNTNIDKCLSEHNKNPIKSLNAFKKLKKCTKSPIKTQQIPSVFNSNKIESPMKFQQIPSVVNSKKTESPIKFQQIPSVINLNKIESPMKFQQKPFKIPVANLHSFKIHSVIGTGSFGQVYLVEKKSTKKYYAMKCLPKKEMFENNLQRYAMTERNVLRKISHEFVVKLRYAFQSPLYLFLVMDYVPGGDLSFHLEKNERFSEKRTRIYAAEILSAISELHKNNIIFRDLKPDNVLIDEQGHIKLSDFGLSKEHVFFEENEQSFCGTFAYLAPEMINRVGHGKSMDWYLFGALLFEMVTGSPPYYCNDQDTLLDNIKYGKLEFTHFLSNDLKDLITKLLERNTKIRICENDIKNHQWFKTVNWNDVSLKKSHPPQPIIPPLCLNQIDNYEHLYFHPHIAFPDIQDWSFSED